MMHTRRGILLTLYLRCSKYQCVGTDSQDTSQIDLNQYKIKRFSKCVLRLHYSSTCICSDERECYGIWCFLEPSSLSKAVLT